MSQFYWPDAPNQLAKWCHRFTRNSLLVDTEIAILNLFPSENLPQFSYHDSVDFSLKKKKQISTRVSFIYIYIHGTVFSRFFMENRRSVGPIRMGHIGLPFGPFGHRRPRRFGPKLGLGELDGHSETTTHKLRLSRASLCAGGL